MSAVMTPEAGEGTGPTRDGMLAELARLRDCAAGQGMEGLRDLLDAVAQAMTAMAEG